MIKKYFEEIENIKEMLVRIKRADESPLYVKKEIAVCERLRTYNEEDMEAFRELLFLIDKNKESKYVNQLKEMYMSVTADDLFARLDARCVAETIDEQIEISDSISRQFGNWSKEEKDLLNNELSRRYQKAAEIENKDEAITTQLKAEVIGGILADSKYFNKRNIF